MLATFSEPQRLCLVVPASSSLSQCDGQWRAARRALPGRFAAQWPCEGCGRLALPILLTCRSAPRGPVAESSGGAEIERARFGRRGWTCAAARVRLVHARPHVLGCCGKSRLAAWPARPFKFLSHSAAAKRAHSADWHGARGRRASPRRRSWPPARAQRPRHSRSASRRRSASERANSHCARRYTREPKSSLEMTCVLGRPTMK